MKDYKYHEKIITDVIEKLKERHIDLYLMITSEGCDPMTGLIPGVDTVGSGAFLFTKDGKKIAIASNIDAQDVEESGLFDQVIRYESYDRTLAETVKNLSPGMIALNYSETVPFCDGLTMGKYNKFVKSMEGYQFRICSSDSFIPEVQEKNKR